ncbi:MAG: leucine-rich repeat domain-containing protein [Cytophagales bacterium]|nr:MAG: leucine-rich repeat domain-containing protein [Cytophagales bacterium]
MNNNDFFNQDKLRQNWQDLQQDFKSFWKNITQEAQNLGSEVAKQINQNLNPPAIWWANMSDEWKKILCQHIEIPYSTTLPTETDIKKIFSLTALDASDANLSDVEPLRLLKNLQEINLNNTQIISVEPLKNLPNLLKIYLMNTHISDLKPLQKLIHLRVLHCSLTQVDNLEPLKNLKNLQEINISETYVRSLKPLNQLLKINMLSCRATPLSPREIRNFQKRHPQASVFCEAEKLNQRKKWSFW